MQIKPIGKAIWTEIRTACEGQLASLQELLEGRFPKSLMELFTAKGSGLFPSPKEIAFHCSCPDWAYMCKHVAAVLYGIGTRLDEDPSLFFVLRKVKMDDLITQAIRDKSARLLKQAKKKTARVIDDADLGDVFGIEMEAATGAENDASEATIVEPEAVPKSRSRAPARKAKTERITKRAKTIGKETKRDRNARMKK
jgi:uncharacterized Zn finger protein